MSTQALKPLKYTVLADEIRAQIGQGQLRPGDRLPSFNQLKAQYDISPATIERTYALLEQENLVVRMQGRGTFVSDNTPQSRTGIVALAGISITNREHPYWTRLLQGLHRVASEAEIALLLYAEEAEVNLDKVDGVILLATSNSYANNLLKRLPPFMPRLAMLVPRPGVINVLPDETQGAYELTRHLIELGHQRISYLYDPISRGRIFGFQNALHDAGIEQNESWLRSLQPSRQTDRELDPDFFEMAYKAMQRWLKEGWSELGCTALMAQNDEAALGAIEALREAGFQVPEQVSVTGFDGTHFGVRFRPSVTSIKVPIEDIGATSMELLVRQLQGEEIKASTIMLPTQLLVGNTTRGVGSDARLAT